MEELAGDGESGGLAATLLSSQYRDPLARIPVRPDP
jgi:hypothetical protein